MPKPPSGFCLSLAGFMKDVYKFKLSLSLKNYFRADTPSSSPHDFVFFFLALSFSHTLSLELLSLNPFIFPSTKGLSAFYFSMMQSEESR